MAGKKDRNIEKMKRRKAPDTSRSRSTRFKPGQSGNPKGRPKKIPDLDKLMRDVFGSTDEGGQRSGMRSVLLALKRKANRGDVKAIQLILDRAYGKAKATISLEHSGAVGFDPTMMNAEDLEKLFELMRKYDRGREDTD